MSDCIDDRYGDWIGNDLQTRPACQQRRQLVVTQLFELMQRNYNAEGAMSV